jgi:hypothetical protein
MELGLSDRHHHPGGLTVQLNKVHHVYGVDDDVGVMAFTDLGAETITELLAMHEVDRRAPSA